MTVQSMASSEPVDHLELGWGSGALAPESRAAMGRFLDDAAS